MPSCGAIVVVPDLQAAVEYYENVLGFTDVMFWGDDHKFAMFPKEDFELRQDAELAAKTARHTISAYIEPEDVDFTYHERKSNGAKIVDDLEDKPWGMRRYVIEDLNGHALRFAGAD